MRISYLYLSSLTLIFLSVVPSQTQTVDPYAYFPVSAGNQWIFRHSGYPSDTFSFRMYRDSLDGEGNRWVWTSSGMLMVDTAYRVWKAYPGSQRMSLRYKLDAELGESWLVYRDEYLSFSTFAMVTEISRVRLFGKVVTYKALYYYYIKDGVADPYWIGTDYLAEGFGWVRWDTEPGIRYIVSGAIIDGVRWGELASVADEDNAEQKDRLDLQAFPNPCRSDVHISWDMSRRLPVTIGLYDGLGRELYPSIGVYESGSSSYSLDLSEYQPGLYVCRIGSVEGSSVQKIIKK